MDSGCGLESGWWGFLGRGVCEGMEGKCVGAFGAVVESGIAASQGM